MKNVPSRLLAPVFALAAALSLQIATAVPPPEMLEPGPGPKVPNLAGLTFTSADKMESGNSPAGPVMGNWKLTFKETTVRWRYSDVVENFQYTMTAEGKITATSAMRKKPLEAAYNAEKKELTWDGKLYKQD